MLTVVALPPSYTNKRYAYARAEYRNARGERRVLVWQVTVASEGRRGTVALRTGLGAVDLPGTREGMSGGELMALCTRIEATGRVSVAGDEIHFPEAAPQPVRLSLSGTNGRRLAEAEP